MADIKIAIIGIDSSHCINFTKGMQGDEGKTIEGMRVVTAMRFPSPFQSEPDQDKRQAQLEKWGVRLTRSFAEAVSGVDALMLCINDPAMHLDFFKQAAATEKPIFLDKPLAGTLADGKAIVKHAREKKARVWTSSMLRFDEALLSAHAAVPKPEIGHVYGALGIAPVGSSIVWYGVHAVEMLVTLMGRGAKTVLARKDKAGALMHVEYDDGRRGVIECNEKAWFYGGRVQTREACRQFAVDSGALNARLLVKLKDFFSNGTIPVPLEDSLEVQAILDAADRSLESRAPQDLLG